LAGHLQVQQTLVDVTAWLVINSMRSEKIQFNLLCEQQVRMHGRGETERRERRRTTTTRTITTKKASQEEGQEEEEEEERRRED
jgi:hypothetical protein